MRKLIFFMAILPVCTTFSLGCGGSDENQVIQQEPGDVTPEMIEIEEGELETVQ